MLKEFTNDTTCPQVYYDQGMNGHTLQPGETKWLSMEDEIPPNGAPTVKSFPPIGMHPVKNFYWNPETRRFEVEFDDTPIE